MGAAVYEASEQIIYKNSFEYLHKPKRFGEELVVLKNTVFRAVNFRILILKRLIVRLLTALF